MFPRKIKLIYDEPLLSGQPPLSGHLPVLRGWQFNGGLTVLSLVLTLVFASLVKFRLY